jgi:hypothetical protein
VQRSGERPRSARDRRAPLLTGAQLARALPRSLRRRPSTSQGGSSSRGAGPAPAVSARGGRLRRCTSRFCSARRRDVPSACTGCGRRGARRRIRLMAGVRAGGRRRPRRGLRSDVPLASVATGVCVGVGYALPFSAASSSSGS